MSREKLLDIESAGSGKSSPQHDTNKNNHSSENSNLKELPKMSPLLHGTGEAPTSSDAVKESGETGNSPNLSDKLAKYQENLEKSRPSSAIFTTTVKTVEKTVETYREILKEIDEEQPILKEYEGLYETYKKSEKKQIPYDEVVEFENTASTPESKILSSVQNADINNLMQTSTGDCTANVNNASWNGLDDLYNTELSPICFVDDSILAGAATRKMPSAGLSASKVLTPSGKILSANSSAPSSAFGGKSIWTADCASVRSVKSDNSDMKKSDKSVEKINPIDKDISGGNAALKRDVNSLKDLYPETSEQVKNAKLYDSPEGFIKEDEIYSTVMKNQDQLHDQAIKRSTPVDELALDKLQKNYENSNNTHVASPVLQKLVRKVASPQKSPNKSASQKNLKKTISGPRLVQLEQLEADVPKAVEKITKPTSTKSDVNSMAAYLATNASVNIVTAEENSPDSNHNNTTFSFNQDAVHEKIQSFSTEAVQKLKDHIERVETKGNAAKEMEKSTSCAPSAAVFRLPSNQTSSKVERRFDDCKIEARVEKISDFGKTTTSTNFEKTVKDLPFLEGDDMSPKIDNNGTFEKKEIMTLKTSMPIQNFDATFLEQAIKQANLAPNKIRSKTKSPAATNSRIRETYGLSSARESFPVNQNLDAVRTLRNLKFPTEKNILDKGVLENLVMKTNPSRNSTPDPYSRRSRSRSASRTSGRSARSSQMIAISESNGNLVEEAQEVSENTANTNYFPNAKNATAVSVYSAPQVYRTPRGTLSSSGFYNRTPNRTPSGSASVYNAGKVFASSYLEATPKLAAQRHAREHGGSRTRNKSSPPNTFNLGKSLRNPTTNLVAERGYGSLKGNLTATSTLMSKYQNSNFSGTGRMPVRAVQSFSSTAPDGSNNPSWMQSLSVGSGVGRGSSANRRGGMNTTTLSSRIDSGSRVGSAVRADTTSASANKNKEKSLERKSSTAKAQRVGRLVSGDIFHAEKFLNKNTPR